MEDYKKKYEDLITSLKKAKNDELVCDDRFGAVIDNIVPELKESEDEKWIPKEIAKYLKEKGDFRSCWIAWLEKQGEQRETLCDKCKREQPHHSCQDITELGRCALEHQNKQKPTDKVEPKFKVGDEIKFAKEPKYPARKIIAIKNDAYYFDELVHLPFINQDKWELVKQKPTDKVEPKFKVGDWIVTDNQTVLFVDKIYESDYYVIDTNNWLPYKYTIKVADEKCHLWTIADAKDGDVLTNGTIILIFKQFKEPNYRQHVIAHIGLDNIGKIQVTNETWNLGIDKTKPATQEQRARLEKAMADAGYKWNKEERKLEKIEQKPAWSKEDEENFNTLSKIICDSQASAKIANKLSDWLKSLKPHSKQEWSEGDEATYNKALDAYYYKDCNDKDDVVFALKDLIDLIEKHRKAIPIYQRWKPSEEQMTALRRMKAAIAGEGEIYKPLNSLYEDLKKLMEE